MPTPLDLIASYRLRLDRQSQADLDRLINAYGLMSARLKDRIDLMLLEWERNPTGDITKTARYKELIAALNAEYAKFDTYLETELESIESKAKSQARLDSAALIAAAVAAFGLTVKPSQIPQSSAPVNALDNEAIKRLHELAPLQAQRIIDALNEGIARGYGYEKLGRMIVDDLGLGLSDALRWARTTQMQAYREQSHNTMLENSNVIDGWTWFAQVDDSTCDGCSELHGTEHTPDETVNDLTPHIWNCRCVELPHVIGDDNPVGGNGWGEEPTAAGDIQDIGVEFGQPTGGAAAEALGDSIVVDEQQYSKMTEAGKENLLSHELAHNIVEDKILGDQEEWQRASDALLLQTRETEATVYNRFMLGESRLGESMVSTIAAYVTDAENPLVGQIASYFSPLSWTPEQWDKAMDWAKHALEFAGTDKAEFNDLVGKFMEELGK